SDPCLASAFVFSVAAMPAMPFMRVLWVLPPASIRLSMALALSTRLLETETVRPLCLKRCSFC
ncbi:hypothetical protein, partial [Psychrobacter sp. AOP29-E1-4]|uniref:hypothetical protein n=1 Tax=Psychrobacter sp. AOP29-E1-4 TaxID=3457703 RepID=UPI0040366CD9